jgi:prevent-host-death family protein
VALAGGGTAGFLTFTNVAGMKTEWLASREFSAHPGRALAAVSRGGRLVVTVKGKPKAIMIPTSEAPIARDLEMLDRVFLMQTVEASEPTRFERH